MKKQLATKRGQIDFIRAVAQVLCVFQLTWGGGSMNYGDID